MYALIDEAVATHFHPDNVSDDFDQYQPSRFRRFFGSKISKVVAGVTTAAALLSGCIFDKGGLVPESRDGRPDVTIPTDAGADAADGADGGADADAAPVQENCTVAGDEDGNGLSDCADPACVGLTGPGPVVGICGNEESLASCTDNYDNDGDGKIDCEDEGCYGASCAEVCDDGQDNDDDGKTDCQDEDCYGTSCAEDCVNPGDEDQNGLEQCLDPVCDGQQGPGPVGTVCEVGSEMSCGDLADNDGDGKTDCGDEDCFDASCEELCNDGADNNLNGQTDCAEPSCNLYEDQEVICVASRAFELDCGNGEDDDGNGQTDCADAACQVTAACGANPVELCDNDIDDDGDGRQDCEQASCALKPPCNERTINCHPLAEGANCPTGIPTDPQGHCPQELGDLPRHCQPMEL